MSDIISTYRGKAEEPEKSYALFEESGVLVLPINSSEYSAFKRKAPLLTALPEELKALSLAEFDEVKLHAISEELRHLVSEDATRISPQQFDHLEKAVSHAEARWASLNKDRSLLKVAAIHHHLLPVSTQESFRPYDTNVSLGFLRHFLRLHDFKVVIHGHKHREMVYRDSIPDVQLQERSYHDLTVISGPCFGTAQDQDSAFQLLEIYNEQYVPKVVIRSFTMAHGVWESFEKKPARIERLFKTPTPEDIETGKALIIHGRTVSEVHQRVIDLLDDEDEDAGQTLVCQIDGTIDRQELANRFSSQEDVLSARSSDEQNRRTPYPEDTSLLSLKSSDIMDC